jgi:diguanylate cyclase (GGDEF)-like protein
MAGGWRRWRRSGAGTGPGEGFARRSSDRRVGERRATGRRRSDFSRVVGWDEQRAQFITRYLFAALGLAYFNWGEPVVRSAAYLYAINAVHLVYLTLTTAYLVLAWRRSQSEGRRRIAMWTDIFGVSGAVLADVNVMSPAYLVYLVIVLGNGMRYGLRSFAEAAAGSFLLALFVLALRFPDYLQSLSVVSVFFMLFVAIIVLYSYSLMVHIERAQRTLEAASRNDALTGLLNRRGLAEHAEGLFKSLARGRGPVAVLFADVDGFKAVNDAYGHDAGDEVLKRVAHAITTTVRASDLVSRFGGDEFVVLMPETDLDGAAVVAKRLQAVVMAAGDGRVSLSLTIGVGLAPDHGADLATVIKCVDAAMYEGKLACGKAVIRRVDGVAVA